MESNFQQRQAPSKRLKEKELLHRAFKTPERERTPTPIPENFSLLPIVEAMGNKRGRKPPKVKSSPIMHMQARKKAKLQQSSAMEQLNKALKITPSNFECKKEPDSDNESS
jgi:hypothetical protein